MLKDEIKKWLDANKINSTYYEPMKKYAIDFKEKETYYISQRRYKYKIHICSIIDNNMVVYKFYGKHKQWWHYDILDKFELTWRIFNRMEVD